MLININNSLNFKDNIKIILSLGIDTIKLEIETINTEPERNLFSLIKSVQEYIVITKELNTNSYTIYNNLVINPETGNGTSIGRINGTMVTLYGLNQIDESQVQFQIINSLINNSTYNIRQDDFNIDSYGLPKDRHSCVFKTNVEKFHVKPSEQLKSNNINLSGIGTTVIVIPDDKKHQVLLKQIKRIFKYNKENIKNVIPHYYMKKDPTADTDGRRYKSFKEVNNEISPIGKIFSNVRSKKLTNRRDKSSYLQVKIQNQKHLIKINKLIEEGDYNIDYNPCFDENGNIKDISKKASKRSLIKYYDKLEKYTEKDYPIDLIENHIEEIITKFKNEYISNENEYDDFELQEQNNWQRIEFVNLFEKSLKLTFDENQITFLAEKIHQKTSRLKVRIFNLSQNNHSQLNEYIKHNNNKKPKELYELKPNKNNFVEYQPSVEEIEQTLRDFIKKINSSI